MPGRKHILFLFACLYASITYGQVRTRQVIPDSLLKLKEGIYFSIDEFLKNRPGVTYPFEIHNTNPDYILFPGEIDWYKIVYTDKNKRQYAYKPEDIWGYYDGKNICVIYRNKPYKLVLLNTISLLVYQKKYKKNTFVNLAEVMEGKYTGNFFTSYRDYLHIIYMDIRNGLILSANRKNFQYLLSSDTVLYREYLNDSRIPKKYRPGIYLTRFNEKYPLTFDNKGIHLYKSGVIPEDTVYEMPKVSNTDIGINSTDAINDFYVSYCDCINKINPNSGYLMDDLQKCQVIRRPVIAESQQNNFANGLAKYLYDNCPKYYVLMNNMNNSRFGYDVVIDSLLLHSRRLDSAECMNIKLTEKVRQKDSGNYFVINDSIKTSYFDFSIAYISKLKWSSGTEFEETVIEDNLLNQPPYKGDIILNEILRYGRGYYVFSKSFKGVEIKTLVRKYN